MSDFCTVSIGSEAIAEYSINCNHLENLVAESFN